MSLAGKLLWAAALLAGSLLSGPLPARSATNLLSATTRTNLIPPTPLPLLFVAKCPVNFFRELLNASGPEREKLLAGRTPENRKQLLAKLREYATMKPDQRELRLRATELRWYLWPLMHQPATNRLEQLQRIPAEDRPLVEARLQEWDKLPTDVQKDLLKNEATIRYLTEVQATNGPAPPSAAPLKTLQAGIEKWNQMPEAQRESLKARFRQFFELRPQEQDKALKTLSEPERRQLEKTLQAFGNLSKSQRDRCIRSFEKFANLSLEERQQFLQNAQRWELMTPKERQDWKDLVSKLSRPYPPFPTGFHRPPLPPTPPLRATNRPVLPVSSNASHNPVGTRSTAAPSISGND